jgi:DNA-binding CsgD family transcriptional regulator
MRTYEQDKKAMHDLERDFLIVSLLMHCGSSKEVAAKLYISKHAIATLWGNKIRKAQAVNTAQLVTYC